MRRGRGIEMGKCLQVDPTTTTTTEPTVIIQDPTKKLNDLIDVFAGNPKVGDSLVYDGERWVTTQPNLFPIGVGRNSPITTDVWLRSFNGVPNNISPILLPEKSVLKVISFTTDNPHTWDIEIYKGLTVRTGGVPSTAPIVSFPVVAANQGQKQVNIEFQALSEIGVFCRGTAISNPLVTLWFAKIN